MPLIWGAVAAGMGLLALAAFGAFGVLLFQAMPLLMQRLENRLLSARKAEARANPIEQLQNDCMRRELRLASFRRALVEIGAQIENMRQMVDERRHIDPAQVLDKQDRCAAEDDAVPRRQRRPAGAGACRAAGLPPAGATEALRVAVRPGRPGGAWTRCARPRWPT